MTRHPLRDRLNRRRFMRALAEAGPDRMVCATTAPTGKPLYFSMPRKATEKEIAARAFEVRNGRGITEGELMLKAAAEARYPKGHSA